MFQKYRQVNIMMMNDNNKNKILKNLYKFHQNNVTTLDPIFMVTIEVYLRTYKILRQEHSVSGVPETVSARYLSQPHQLQRRV